MPDNTTDVQMQAEAEDAARAEAWLADLERHPESVIVLDGAPIGAITRAGEQVEAADVALLNAVAAARAAGHPWLVIGRALGLSEQDARARYGDDREG